MPDCGLLARLKGGTVTGTGRVRPSVRRRRRRPGSVAAGRFRASSSVGDDQDGGIGLRQGRAIWAAGLRERVADVVDLDAEVAQPAERVRADPRVVLADAGGEDDGVGAAEDGEVGAHVVPDPVAVTARAPAGLASSPALARRCTSRRSLAPASPSSPPPPVEQLSSSVDRQPGPRGAGRNSAPGSMSPGAGAHDQALQRRQPRRRVDRTRLPPRAAVADAPLPRCST